MKHCWLPFAEPLTDQILQTSKIINKLPSDGQVFDAGFHFHLLAKSYSSHCFCENCILDRKKLPFTNIHVVSSAKKSMIKRQNSENIKKAVQLLQQNGGPLQARTGMKPVTLTKPNNGTKTAENGKHFSLSKLITPDQTKQ